VGDSKVFVSLSMKDIHAAQQHLEKDLSHAPEWCCNNQLLINPDKTKLLLVATRQTLQRLPKNLNLTLLAKTIMTVTSAKDPGIIVDSHLTYDCHINTFCPSLAENKLSFSFRKLR